jgi:tRNA G46 methylase TrmB
MRFNDILSIIKKHGLYNGLRRIRDEFFENYLFDLVNKTSTREIVVKKNYSKLFYNNNDNKKKILMLRGGGDKWYQPTYATPLIKTLEFLKKNILYYKKDEVIFIDIGCGKGKPNYIFSKLFPQITSCGIEMYNYYKKIFINNLKLVTKNFIFINEKAQCINFNLFNKKKLIILHNKNSFTFSNLILILKKLHKLNRKIYLIYNNPHFHSKIIKIKSLNKKKIYFRLVFSVNGWHKNFNTNVYSLEK